MYILLSFGYVMKIIPIPAFIDNYIWLLIDTANKTAVCVDPGTAKPVLDYLYQHQLSLIALLLTHHHHDHIDGCSDLLSVYPDLLVYGPNDPRINSITDPVGEPASITLANWQFDILNIPGHTASHIAFYEPTINALFCGDTLFSAGCGRIFDGSLNGLMNSLVKLTNLPDDTYIYCGHEYTYQNLRFAAHVEPKNQDIQKLITLFSKQPNRCSLPSTMALEKRINPFLRTTCAEVKEYTKQRGCLMLDSLSVFKRLREDKNNFN
jgi:hydroxyacylglutathione hydrolase